MENKDDLISRGAVLNMLHNESVMHTPYEQYEAAARKHLAEDISQQVESLPGQMTAAEAWEIARKIACAEYSGELSGEELKEIFDTVYLSKIFDDYTPEEVREKIAAWENRLKVGDVVEHISDKKKVVITHIEPSIKIGNELYQILYQDGKSYVVFTGALRKTGKTIDIQSVLDQLGE